MVKVIGLTGTIGSGKNVVVQYIKQRFDSYYVKISDILRTELHRKKGNLNRKTLQDLGNELRKKYGTHILAKLAIEYLQRDKKVIVIDGIRNPGEIEYLRKNFGKDFTLIATDAPPELRFENLKKRARVDDPLTWEEFLVADARDQGINEPEWGQQTKKCIEQADFLIENNSSLEEFQRKIDETMKKVF